MSEPRPPKRERTRRKLLDAGLRVLADRGDALTASDVVAVADVANGTFYNHFLDREDFMQALAHESLKTISATSAEETEGSDPAWRFAVASTRVLLTGVREPLWGRAVLRLIGCPSPPHAAVQQYLRADLAEGHRIGRFDYGDDPVTVDLVSGTILAALRRLVSVSIDLDDDVDVDVDLDDDDDVDVDVAAIDDHHAVPDVVTRLLEVIGLDHDEAKALATAAHNDEQPDN